MKKIYPEMALFRQHLVDLSIPDEAAAVNDTLVALCSQTDVNLAGRHIAVAVGSRKIDRLDSVVKSVVDFLQSKGADAFIVTAMGSHGGATPEGQLDILSSYGITKESMGVPVLASMDVRSIGKTRSGFEVFISSDVIGADGVVVINRVKPHTKFRADIESGLCKMLVIGLGKEKGASEFHRFAVQSSFSIIEEGADLIIKKLPVLFGLALVEDGRHRLSWVEAIPARQIIEREKALLLKARDLMPKIPFSSIDLLIVDRIGKDISGIGMDSNVTGRHRDITGDFSFPPAPKRIFVRELSPGSDGNGNGLGLADFTTSRLVRQLDLQKTFKNAVAAISPEKGAIPIHFETDAECVEAALHTCGLDSATNARIVRLKDTLNLEYMHVSKSLENEAAKAGLMRVSPWEPMKFDKRGNLYEFNLL